MRTLTLKVLLPDIRSAYAICLHHLPTPSAFTPIHRFLFAAICGLVNVSFPFVVGLYPNVHCTTYVAFRNFYTFIVSVFYLGATYDWNLDSLTSSSASNMTLILAFSSESTKTISPSHIGLEMVNIRTQTLKGLSSCFVFSCRCFICILFKLIKTYFMQQNTVKTMFGY